jgi:transcriptional regulator with GAF, ATPase, and Fis domain
VGTLHYSKVKALRRIDALYAMKNKRFSINLYIIIPVIFAGLAALAFISAYQLTRHYHESMESEWSLSFWGISLVLFTFICGLITVKLIIDPVKRFVDKTQSLAVIRNSPEIPAKSNPTEMHPFTRVFDQVSELLGKVEARELFPDIIGQSPALRSVLNRIIKVAPTDTTVLLTGETGTGKELLANSIHRHSRRHKNAFIALNCAAIPANLLESELFGHEKGAFTGAAARKPGKFELAHGGTLFLDEVGDMPLEIQAKVLRALEERQIQRLGGVQPIKVDVRFIAATNRSLTDLVEQGLFRKDLYYRLSVFLIHLPPLRERREDIPLLAEYLLKKGTDKISKFSSAALQLLMVYDWPGNIRELQSAIHSAALMADSMIEPHHFPALISRSCQSVPEIPPEPDEALNLDQRLGIIEKGILIQALNQTKGVQKRAAQLLGIKERSLWHRLKKYGIEAADYKER